MLWEMQAGDAKLICEFHLPNLYSGCKLTHGFKSATFMVRVFPEYREMGWDWYWWGEIDTPKSLAFTGLLKFQVDI